ncbi:pentatricopeptide repeat-containing protein At1g06140, mitochondrial-like [Selaginella moellendorffii]|uniref:pentatricopeptide repeat-containing protein At1g06140, mitochondrial-like n=1 Tax=Selaginella moellendorffii TaxID=88036 RepID=UPI000D1CE1FF|nr:pentatricopeptide repeat-containing protein At1g06140, mitochondrial-like [Selaginella moellendorffii]|eukprot:XP_024518733.1 pentatricopeptide repeat-containing protein At1g06140, mitochondrial-like [Selaginella moellendorffii]
MPEHTVVSWTVLVLGYVDNGEAEMALELFACIPDACGPIGARALVAGLKACSSLAAREEGKLQEEQGGGGGGGRVLKVEALKKAVALHSQAMECGCEMEGFVASSLVDLYSRCGDLEEARKILDRMSYDCVVSATALMLGYAEHGQGEKALELFARMGSRDSRAFLAALKACICLATKEDGKLVGGRIVKLKSLETGMDIHLEAVRSGHNAGDIFVASSLVDMYAKCGSMIDARGVFDRMASHSVVSWTALVLGYAENEEEALALELLPRVESPNALTFVAGLKACAGLGAKEDGDLIEGKLVKLLSLEKVMALELECGGLTSDIFVANTLLDVYAKCGSTLDARRVFDRMEFHTTVSWTALVMGYAENGEHELALELFSCMRSSIAPSALSFVAAMSACSGLAAKEEATKDDEQSFKLKSLERARNIYCEAVESGFQEDIFVANSAVDLLAKCGSLVEARRTFERIRRRNTVSWNALMLGYSENGEGEKCLNLFSRMEKECQAPDARTFFAALKGCVVLASKEDENQAEKKKLSLETGMAIHLQAEKSGCCDSDVFVASTLVEMYAKCGSLVDARKVFDKIPGLNLSAWTALIQGYAEGGEELAALEIFASLQSRKGYVASVPAFVAAIKACTGLAAKEKVGAAKIDGRTVKVESLRSGMAIHSQVERSDHSANTMVANTLIDMYARCGSLVDARRVFDRAMIHSDSSWNTLILGYAENAEAELALELFSCMGSGSGGSPRPNSRTLVAALKACSAVASLGIARSIHSELLRRGIDRNVVLESSLVDVYGKCGSMAAAQREFDTITRVKRDLVTWNAILAGYARQGDAASVLGLFPRFREEGLRPDEITLASVLTACSRAGLVDKGREIFESMSSSYGVAPSLEHYHCMVDLLGRANRLEEAMAVVKSMPFEANGVTWMTVLAACGKWKNAVVGKVAFDSLLELDQGDAATYVSMANIYHDLIDL